MKVNNHNKTQLYLDVFNRISHYNHLLQAAAPKPKKDELVHAPNLCRFDTKLYHSIEQQRRYNNGVMLKKLVAIHKKPLKSQRYQGKSKSPKNVTTYKSVEMDKERLRMNSMLYKKILKVRPIIGSHEEWDQHYGRFLQNQKKLSKQPPDLSGIDNRFYQTYTDLCSRGSKRRISLNSEHSTRFTKPLTAALEKEKSIKDSEQLDAGTLNLETLNNKPEKKQRRKRRRTSKRKSGEKEEDGYVFTREDQAQEYHRLLEEYQT